MLFCVSQGFVKMHSNVEIFGKCYISNIIYKLYFSYDNLFIILVHLNIPLKSNSNSIALQHMWYLLIFLSM